MGFLSPGVMMGPNRRRSGIEPILHLDFANAFDSAFEQIDYVADTNKRRFNENMVLAYAPHQVYTNTDTIGGTGWFTFRMEPRVTGQPDSDGGTGAVLFEVSESNSGGSASRQTIGVSGAGNNITFTFEVIAKNPSGNPGTGWVNLELSNGDGDAARHFFNLDAGVIGSSQIASDAVEVSSSMSSLGDGFFRLSLTARITAGSNTSAAFAIAENDNDKSADDGDQVIFYKPSCFRGNEGNQEYVANTSGAAIFPEDMDNHRLITRENHIRNNTMQGAVAGVPGTAPTNWLIAPGGTTREIVATGVADGKQFVDIKFSGTPSGDLEIGFEGLTIIDALTGEDWVVSSYLALIAGDLSNITAIRFFIHERTEAGASVAIQIGPDIKGDLTTTIQRFESPETLGGGATTAHIEPALSIDWDGSGAIDLTLRFWLPALERELAATLPDIKTFGGVVTVDEWRPHNLILESSDFGTTWVQNFNPTLSTNTTIAPDGTLTADTLGDNSVNFQPSFSQTFVVVDDNKDHTFSLYILKNPSTTHFPEVLMRYTNGGTETDYRIRLNTATGVTDTSVATAPNSFGAINSGDYWRLFMTAPNVGDGNVRLDFFISPAKSGGIGDPLANEPIGEIVAWGFQVTRGSELFPHVPTTTTAIAALPFGQAVGLRVESASDNDLLHSEDPTNAAWLKSLVTIDANSIIAPDGNSTADTIVEDGTAAAGHFIQQVVDDLVFVTNDDYTFHFIAQKTANRNWCSFDVRNKASTTFVAYFDLDRGIEGSISGSATSKIKYVGNNWYHCAITLNIGSGVADPRIRIRVADSDGGNIFDGLSQDSIYVWGMVGENGDKDSTYMATTTVSVGRDAIQAPVDVFPAGFNQLEGTIVWKGTVAGVVGDAALWSISDNSVNNQIFARRPSGSRVIQASIYNGSFQMQDSTANSFTDSEEFTHAFAWKVDDANHVLNGSDLNPDTSVVLPVGFTDLDLGGRWDNSNPLNGDIGLVDLYAERIPDPELAGLN